MTKPAREIIFGVCDKTGNCDSYFGFFKNEDDARKELKVQAERMMNEFGMTELVIKGDRAIKPITDREEELVLILHPFVLR